MKRAAVRITGAGDRQRLVEVFRKQRPGSPEPKESKGPRGETITTLHKEGHPPALMFVGDNELIWGGYEQDKDNHLEVLESVLAVRAGKVKGMVTGPLADELKLIPSNSRAGMAVTLPDALRQQMVRGNSPFKAAPQKVLVYATRGEGLALAGLAAMKDEAEAKGLAQTAEELKKQGLQFLDNPPPGAKIPKELVGMLKDTLKGITIEASGNTVKARAALPSEKLVGEVIKLLFEGSPPER
jgi:hypothetical protein